jgi:alpha-beta hydrolase superfamily lysophospholipase
MHVFLRSLARVPGCHCTAAFLALFLTALHAQTPSENPAPATGEASFSVFIRGAEVGRVQTNLSRTGSDWLITSTGRVGDLVINRFELKYGADWQPIDLRIEATQTDKKMQLNTSFGVTTAINEITQNAVTNAKTDQISARTVVLPNLFIAAYEALAARLSVTGPGAELPVYVAPQAEVKLAVKTVTGETVQTPSGSIATRRYEIVIQNPGGPLTATVTIDDKARFAKLELPAASMLVVRTDLSSVAVRTQSARNPTDSDVTIPAAGFTIAGTLTLPPGASGSAGRLRHPTIVLVAGSGPVDRDALVAGIPIFTQLAGDLAKRGYMVLRYDKRGVGQSGGRTETATLQDYADDLVAIVRWLERRDDVDDNRLAVVGHSEGGAIAMLAAGRDKRIKALALVAAPGSTGAELILEQQSHQLDLMKVSEEERAEKIALQKKIQQAVLSGKGLDGLPPQIQKQANTPWFRSLLAFDPAQAMEKVAQPVLILQGDLDVQVPPHHADKLAELARARKKEAIVEVVHIPGINHLLVPATTGEVQEYQALTEKKVSEQVSVTIADWLKKIG